MATANRIFLGIDAGSVSVNTVVMNQNKDVLEEYYTRTMGQPLETVGRILAELLSRFDKDQVEAASLTGTAGKLIAELIGGNFVNEIIAQSKSIELFYPRVKTVIEIGGEDSKLILLDYDQSQQRTKIVDFAMNTICAAGTGSFLDQQAHRLGLSIEEFGNLALKSENPPRIAGRCSVFAKTDMIHLQQGATPDFDIVAGLCYALARNFKSNIGKGKTFAPPVSFQGGVAANAGMRRVFLNVLDLAEEEFIIPKHFASMGAIGAVIVTMEDQDKRRIVFYGLSKLQNYLETRREKSTGLSPLTPSKENKRETGITPRPFVSKKEDKVDAFLGIDVGSISTNVVAINRDRNLLSKRYLMTAGRPIEAIKQGLKEVGKEIGDYINIRGVGTTGSGRYLTGDFVGADTVRNEITTQATAAINIDPNLDTIFEIGGQDSKYISIENGTIVDFEMNKVCAAGTGSFLEEQAEKLGISIREEFGDLALRASSPVSLGERCTVFMESDLVHHQQRGANKDNLVAGLSYSIAMNYLNKVVGDRKIGDRVFFQGGTAFNRGVVAAFEKLLGKHVEVPPNNEVTGAIGAAILAMEENGDGKSKFKGFDLSERSYSLAAFECQGCPNMCEIRKLTVQGERPLFYGSRCEKYEVNNEKKRGNNLPDLFAEREALLHNIYKRDDRLSLANDAPVIGIPNILFFHELLPFWKTFFNELGFRVVVTEKTNKKTIRKGVESVVAETCFPIKVSHGHILELIDKGTKTIFLPSIINMEQTHPDMKDTYNCPYVQAFPYTVKSAINFEEHGIRLLQPVIYLGRGRDGLERPLMRMARELKIPSRKVKKAISEALDAQKSFYSTLHARGAQILNNLKEDQKAMVIVSRPYNGCDSGINLDIPKKLRDLGVLAIPIDCLPVDRADLTDASGHMYWKYEQRFLAAAHIIKNNPNLYAVYITNFSCGPDSFISHFFRDKLKGKPYLQIEIDEHSADVGAITRLEAFLDTLKNVRREMVVSKGRKTMSATIKKGKKRKVYLPYMSDHSFAVSAAFEACGIPSAVIPESDEETLELGRKFTSGRECYPCILTSGNMVRLLKDPDFDRQNSAFFMPSANGPCRFGQYHRFHRMVLDELGYDDVPIYALNQDENIYRELQVVGKKLARLVWQGIVVTDILEKKLRETRPYEKNPGETERVYQDLLQKVSYVVRKGEDLFETLKEARAEFDRIEINNSGEKPVIGIVGEIYIRSNKFSNENIVRQIERLGGEVWLPPISEWVLYTNFTAKRKSLMDKNHKAFLRICLTEFFQKRDEHRLQEAFDGSIRNLREPTTRQTLKWAKPYLDSSFEGEAVLSIGKAVDFYKKGVSGIVNVMPFTCMPGTIVSALLNRYREDQNNIPVLNMAYDGQENTSTQTRRRSSTRFDNTRNR